MTCSRCSAPAGSSTSAARGGGWRAGRAPRGGGRPAGVGGGGTGRTSSTRTSRSGSARYASAPACCPPPAPPRSARPPCPPPRAEGPGRRSTRPPRRGPARRPALREAPVPPPSPPLTVVYLRLIGEFLDKIVRHPDYISLAADEVQPSTEGYNDILNALWHVKSVLEKIVVADDTPVLVAVSARYGQVAREFGRMEARLLTDEDTDLSAPTVEFVHWQRQQARAASPAPPDEASHLSLDKLD